MATLTPAELAMLLGPQADRDVAVTPLPQPTEGGWNGFAERFAKGLTAQLRSQVRSATRVQLASCRRLRADAVFSEVESSAVSEVWQMPNVDEPLAASMSSLLVVSFVNRLLGGGSISAGDSTAETRSLSETDRQFAVRLVDSIRESFLVTFRAEPDSTSESLSRISTLLTEAWLPDCELVRLRFDVRFVHGGGSFDLLLPIELADRLADETPQAAEQDRDVANSIRQNATDKTRLRRVSVCLAQTSLPASDLRRLAVGDVLLTETEVGQPCEVLIDGQPRFLAEPGQLNGHKAARLISAVDQ